MCLHCVLSSLSLSLSLRYIYDNVFHIVDGPLQVWVNFSSALSLSFICPIPLPASALSVFLLLLLSSSRSFCLFCVSHPHFLSLDIVCLFLTADFILPSQLSLPISVFHPLSPSFSSSSVTLIPCLIHWRFIGIRAGLFCQAITVQNSMKVQFSKCAFSLFPWHPLLLHERVVFLFFALQFCFVSFIQAVVLFLVSSFILNTSLLFWYLPSPSFSDFLLPDATSSLHFLLSPVSQ